MSLFSSCKVIDADAGWAQEAASYQGMTHNQGEPGYAESKELRWLEVSDYPISRLVDATDAKWFKEEREMWAEEGQPERFDDMLDSEIHSPIIIFDDGHHGYIWDGYHRVGATVTRGVATIKAIVGVRADCEHLLTQNILKFNHDAGVFGQTNTKSKSNGPKP